MLNKAKSLPVWKSEKTTGKISIGFICSLSSVLNIDFLQEFTALVLKEWNEEIVRFNHYFTECSCKAHYFFFEIREKMNIDIDVTVCLITGIEKYHHPSPIRSEYEFFVCLVDQINTIIFSFFCYSGGKTLLLSRTRLSSKRSGIR